MACPPPEQSDSQSLSLFSSHLELIRCLNLIVRVSTHHRIHNSSILTKAQRQCVDSAGGPKALGSCPLAATCGTGEVMITIAGAVD